MKRVLGPQDPAPDVPAIRRPRRDRVGVASSLAPFGPVSRRDAVPQPGPTDRILSVTSWAVATVQRASFASTALRVGVVVSLTAVAGMLDWLTGPTISMLLVQAVAVVVAGWTVRPPAVLVVVAILALSSGWLQHAESDSGLGVVAVNSLARALSLGLLAAITLALRAYAGALEELATRDPLTGSLNRRGFLQALDLEIARAHRQDRTFSVAYFDLDGLKRVNDLGGHAAGDVVLRRFADGLTGGLRDGDVVARLGGDEFAAILTETDEPQGTEVVRRMFDADVLPSASFGVCAWRPGSPLDGEALLAAADRAMFCEKRRRR